MFPIIQVPSGAAELTEQLGTKYKFWYPDEHLGNTLFKEGRPGTGENWAEKVACELALVIGLPHAYYELAAFGNRDGVVSPSFVPEGARLIHANEVLGSVTSSFNPDGAERAYYRDRSHTISRVFSFFKKSSGVLPPTGFTPFGGVVAAADVLVGYLMFDAWIANQDRHNQNWGLIRGVNAQPPVDPVGSIHLAPSYDHGSSMGRNETDERREKILTTRDKGQQMSAYVLRASSGLYPPLADMSDAKVKTLPTLEAFEAAMKQRPAAGRSWLQRLNAVPDAKAAEIVELIPDTHASSITKKFTALLLQENRKRLLSL